VTSAAGWRVKPTRIPPAKLTTTWFLTHRRNRRRNRRRRRQLVTAGEAACLRELPPTSVEKGRMPTNGTRRCRQQHAKMGSTTCPRVIPFTVQKTWSRATLELTQGCHRSFQHMGLVTFAHTERKTTVFTRSSSIANICSANNKLRSHSLNKREELLSY